MLHRQRLALLLLSTVLLLPAAVATHAAEMVSVARGNVNMRSGPSVHHNAEWVVSGGYPLAVLGRKDGWLRVRDFENDRGWVLGSLVDRTPHYIVVAKVANLRRAPGTRSGIVGKAKYGEVLRTLDRRGDWIRVRHERGTTGWVARRLVWGW